MRLGRLSARAWRDASSALLDDPKCSLRIDDLVALETRPSPGLLATLPDLYLVDDDDDDIDRDAGQWDPATYQETVDEILVRRGKGIITVGACAVACERYMVLLDEFSDAEDVPPPLASASAPSASLSSLQSGRQAAMPLSQSSICSGDRGQGEREGTLPTRRDVSWPSLLTRLESPGVLFVEPGLVVSPHAKSCPALTSSPGPRPTPPCPTGGSKPAGSTDSISAAGDCSSTRSTVPPPSIQDLLDLAATAPGGSFSDYYTTLDLPPLPAVDFADATLADRIARIPIVPIPPLPPAPFLRTNSSSATIVSDDNCDDDDDVTDHDPTLMTLLNLARDAPALTVPQLDAVIHGADARYGTAQVAHWTDPTRLVTSSRALRALALRVPLRHVAVVVHWMVARVADRVPRNIERDSLPELADVARNDPRGDEKLMIPAWSPAAIAKLLTVLTFEVPGDVAGLVVAYIARAWTPSMLARIVTVMLQDEPASVAALFVKSLAATWSLTHLAEIISFIDCSLHWREPYFARFMRRLFHYIRENARLDPLSDDGPRSASESLASLATDVGAKSSESLSASELTADNRPDASALPPGTAAQDGPSPPTPPPPPPPPPRRSLETTITGLRLLGRDPALRLFFLASLYRTSLAVQRMQLAELQARSESAAADAPDLDGSSVEEEDHESR